MISKTGLISFLTVVLFLSFCYGQNVGVSPWLWVASYGTDSYQSPGESSTPNAELMARTFNNYLSSKIGASSYSQSINLNQYYLRLGPNDSWANYSNDQNVCEFLVVAGHGAPAALFFYDGLQNIFSKPLGGYTKWLFSFACNTLQPFSDNNLASYQQSIWNTFNGLHGMFGFGSKVWGRTSYPCGFLWTKTCYKTPESLWDEFLQRWVISKQPMATAWFNAAYYRLYKYMNYTGVVPVVCGIGVWDNGVHIIGYNETIDKTYLSQMPSGSAATEWYSAYARYGSPQY